MKKKILNGPALSNTRSKRLDPYAARCIQDPGHCSTCTCLHSTNATFVSAFTNITFVY